MDKINTELLNVKKVVIAGHVRPDGDCVGSCTALYQYLMQNKDLFQIETVDVYLEPFGDEFQTLTGADVIQYSYEKDEIYDVFISLDCGSLDRLGNALKYFNTARKTINIDHHISNSYFANVNHVLPNASSTCEVLYTIMDETLITKEIATSLYVGIIHDTAVFKHSNTSELTMNIAGSLIGKGIPFSQLIDDSFYSKTYMQNQIMGRCLMESILVLEGKVIVACIDKRQQDFYQAKNSDFDGIIDQLRVTKGVEVAIFVYELSEHEFKVSMRSNGVVNVSDIAVYFGGGGHVKAAGCTMIGYFRDVINNLTPHIEAQLRRHDKM